MALPEEPYTRVERYLARLSGQNVDIPDYPITRIECYLDYLCGNGGGVPAPNAGAHNGIFRGRSLGGSLTGAQLDAIDRGTFEDLYIGDYWTISGVTYRIAGFDLFLHTGDGTNDLTTHHAVIVPDTFLYRSAMNEEATAAGGYLGSRMKLSGLDDALTTITAAFGAEHILERRSLLCSAISGGSPSGWTWATTKLDLMSEGQVFGRGAWGTQNQNAYNIGERYSRFPLFQLCPEYVVVRTSWYWLQDVRYATTFCYVSLDGVPNSNAANASGGVRPFFCIGKVTAP